MKQQDARYYAEQINSFTPAKAKTKGGELIVDFLDGSPKEKTRDEEIADLLYKKARKKEGS